MITQFWDFIIVLSSVVKLMAVKLSNHTFWIQGPFFVFLPLSLRVLLTNDFAVFQQINIWSPFVIIGVYCASLSAAMCSLIGASRILHALAIDQLFGMCVCALVSMCKEMNSERVKGFVKKQDEDVEGRVLMCFCLSGLPLAPAAITSRSGNPWVSVLYTWALVQVRPVNM